MRYEAHSCMRMRVLRGACVLRRCDQIKADPRLEEMVLVKNSRLSVQPVSEAEWGAICALGETDPG